MEDLGSVTGLKSNGNGILISHNPQSTKSLSLGCRLSLIKAPQPFLSVLGGSFWIPSESSCLTSSFFPRFSVCCLFLYSNTTVNYYVLGHVKSSTHPGILQYVIWPRAVSFPVNRAGVGANRNRRGRWQILNWNNQDILHIDRDAGVLRRQLCVESINSL